MESTKTEVIGLFGKAGSGKDTAFSVLKDYYASKDKTAVRVAFGDEVKREYSEASNISICEIETKKASFREELQHWGTEYRRNIDPDYWIKKIDLQVQFLKGQADVIVFTDVRFHNEADYVRDLQGFMVKVKPPKTFRIGKHHEHTSETELDDILPDYILQNDGEKAMEVQWKSIMLEIKDTNEPRV